MPYDPQIHHRQSIRLRGYDYTQPGAYFVTLVTWQRDCLFGKIVDGMMQLNDIGEIVEQEWQRSSDIRQELELDLYVVMPNHLHGVVIIHDVGADGHLVGADGRFVGADGCPPLPVRQPKSLGAFVAGYKSAVTKRVNAMRTTPGLPVWQRNYYEHIVRNESELNRIRQYIADNPTQWEMDHEYRSA